MRPHPGHGRAQRAYPIAGRSCESCNNKPASDRHHKDGDPSNNAKENIAFLCRRCHMVADGRIWAFVERARANARAMRTEPRPCIQCSELAKPTRVGLCSRCYDRKRYARRKEAQRAA